ncbi:ACT domain-containing protein [Rhizobium sp. P40RR-XXII]|uniref:ACT domain-containing protein n=1 Tax=Rhizobium sp. P40RR-XXII TaxID=2726739 RepID=UPI001456B6B8|nr:ACT domain-containing protein [Rhizobium sp. P40RR-XXII]NLS21142.1 ACT domain-containing protein [Rhizobium sp. P40RR-XXII]
MTKLLSSALEMLSNMAPTLQDGEYVFCSVSSAIDIHGLRAIGTFRESEGLTIITERGNAFEAGLDVSIAMRQITLNVKSALEGVGLTAGVSVALAEAGIPSNMVAAFHHDHIFVPAELADRAMRVLKSVQDEALQAIATI